LPRDGASSGRLMVRGPCIVERYNGHEVDALDGDGFFDTGDIATIDPLGHMQITDRAKDVIKSGGEWISSVQLEHAALGCEGVRRPLSKWDERPLLYVVKNLAQQYRATIFCAFRRPTSPNVGYRMTSSSWKNCRIRQPEKC
jgi:fatty-acyl-CoA synthase